VFAFQDTSAAIEIAFTDRHGGVSGGPYSSLNLALSGGDSAAHVRENLRLATCAFAGAGSEPSVVAMHQVHGSGVAVVDGPLEDPPHVDGLVTVEPGVVLVVRVADCVPVLLADPDNGVVAAAHAGRQGLVAGIVPRTIDVMRAQGARRILAWVGPHVCGKCYEVPAAMRAEVASVVPESYAETSWGTSAVDVGAGVRAQLAAHGIESVSVERCTIEDEDLFSYRRQGTASGRLAGMVWIRP